MAKKTVKRKASRKRKTTRRKVSAKNEHLTISGVSMVGKKRRKSRTRRKTSHKRRKHTALSGEFMGGKRRKSSRRRVHRMHGDKSGVMQSVMGTGAMIGGAVAGSMIAKFIPVQNVKIKAAIPLALGIVLQMLKFGRKGLVKDVAQGMAVMGGIALIKDMIPAVPMMGYDADIMGYLPTSPEQAAMLGYMTENMAGNEFSNAQEIAGLEGDDFVSPANL